MEKNDELSESLKRYSIEMSEKCAIYEDEISNLNFQLSKSKIECNNYKYEYEKLRNEHQEFILKQSTNNDENRKFKYDYENELINLSKELKKTKNDFASCQLNYDLKCDEVKRLQQHINELNDFKERFHVNEQKLSTQIKTNQIMQDNLVQLQNYLTSKGYQTNSPTSESSSYENIIENLKFIVKEQFALRNVRNSQSEIDDLKLKVKFILKQKKFSKIMFHEFQMYLNSNLI